MVGPFPVVKLGYLALKQISKPIVILMKNRAKSNKFFRTKVCIPIAQFYHGFDVNIRMRLLGLGKAKSIEPLTDEMATDLGAEMLGELLMYSTAATILIIEYQSQSAKNELKEEERKQRLINIESRIDDLRLKCAEQDTRIRELDRSVTELESKKSEKKAGIWSK